MRRKKEPAFPSNLKAVRDQLERWRKTSKKRSRIPEALWQSAARLAEEYGTNKTAKALRLNYYDLKKRLNGAATQSLPERCSRPTFVELDLRPGAPPGQWVVEMEHRSGAKLKIALAGHSSGVDVVALSEAFWRQGS